MDKILNNIKAIIAAGIPATMFGCPIDGGNAFNCAAQTQAGITSRLLLYNWDDWKAATLTIDVDGTITGIVNGSTLQAWDFSVSEEGNLIPLAALRIVDGGADGYDHSIDSRGFDVSQAGAAQISKMRFQKMVAIIERVDGTAKVYGENVGMRLSDLQFNEGSTDTGGVIQFILKTPDGGSPEISLPTVIDAGTPATTVALLDGLTTPGA